MIECTTLYGDKKMIPKEKLFFRPGAYAIIVNNGKILLMNTKSTGKYWFPGGGVEIGEKIEQGLKREVREETGIEVEIQKFLALRENFFYYAPLDEATHSFSFFYLCKPITTDLLPNDNANPKDESEKPQWIDLKEIKKENMQPGGEGIFELI